MSGEGVAYCASSMRNGVKMFNAKYSMGSKGVSEAETASSL